MANEVYTGVYPAAQINIDRDFSREEAKIAKYWSNYFYITSAGKRTLNNSDYKFLLVKPTTRLEEALSLSREIVVIISPYSSFEPRTLEAFSHYTTELLDQRYEKIAMLNQSGRYHNRAQKDIDNGLYDSYSVIIVAPAKYLEANKEAHKYDYKVQYEEMRNYFASETDIRSEYKCAMIDAAILEQKNGYQWEENKDVARFNADMHEYQRKYFPEIPLGTVAWWPHYKSLLDNTYIVFKANKGYCDLTFSLPVDEVIKNIKGYLTPEMSIVKTGKSTSVRIIVNPIRFEDEFEDVVEDVDIALKAVKKLLDFSLNLKQNQK